MLGRNRENSIHLSSPIWDPGLVQDQFHSAHGLSSIWDPTTQHNDFLAPHEEAQFGFKLYGRN